MQSAIRNPQPATRRVYIYLAGLLSVFALSGTAHAQESGPAAGNCNFVCERFSHVEDFSGTTLPDGNHTVDFVTTPLGFRYQPRATQYALVWQAIQIGTSVLGSTLCPEHKLHSNAALVPAGDFGKHRYGTGPLARRWPMDDHTGRCGRKSCYRSSRIARPSAEWGH